jgi:hypothetical protein
MSSSKILPVKGLCGRCLSEFRETGDAVRYVGISNPALWTVAPLTYSLVQLSPLSLPVYTYTRTNTVCKRRGVWGSVPQTDNHLPQSPLTSQFFMTTFCIAFSESYFSTCKTVSRIDLRALSEVMTNVNLDYLKQFRYKKTIYFFRCRWSIHNTVHHR